MAAGDKSEMVEEALWRLDWELIFSNAKRKAKMESSIPWRLV